MNATVSKTINGQVISARPVFKGGEQPAYWTAIVNERSLPRQFPTATAIFRFASRELQN
ncbi:MAG: hypothetical protein ACLGH6_11765 [Gammaproteobacteria bacterium]